MGLKRRSYLESIMLVCVGRQDTKSPNMQSSEVRSGKRFPTLKRTWRMVHRSRLRFFAPTEADGIFGG